jgi:hypothetical protein
MRVAGGALNREAYLLDFKGEGSMGCEKQAERRQASQAREAEPRGAIWSLPDGQRLPNLVDASPLVVGDPAHPARLLFSDLDDPQGFHSRLTAWLLQQG